MFGVEAASLLMSRDLVGCRSYRGVDKCTDVLSVPHEYFMHNHGGDEVDGGGGGDSSSSSSGGGGGGGTPVELGDIIICPLYAPPLPQ